MLILPFDQRTYADPQLLQQVCSQAIDLGRPSTDQIYSMMDWCHQCWGFNRPGNVLAEPIRGVWQDYAGSWQISDTPNIYRKTYVAWFDARPKMVEFALTWT